MKKAHAAVRAHQQLPAAAVERVLDQGHARPALAAASWLRGPVASPPGGLCARKPAGHPAAGEAT